MYECIRCRAEFPDFSRLEPNVDHFGMHFMCPECGRRNGLRVIGHNGDTLLVEQQPEPARK